MLDLMTRTRSGVQRESGAPRVTLGAIAAATLVALAGGCGNITRLDDAGPGDGTADSGPGGSSTDGGQGALIDSGAVAIDSGAVGIDGGSIDAGPRGCDESECPFGCDPDSGEDACLPAKLWVYPTAGQYLADGFGGQDNTVRATSDLLCVATAEERYAARSCNRDRTHAVLFVSQGDSIPLMATQYEIPTDAPVHRADDDVRVFASWNDLIDTTNTRPPAAPVTLASPGFVWSGALGTSTCLSWTTAASGQLGNQGDTSVTSANWLSRRGGIACDQLANLLCICWSGGE